MAKPKTSSVSPRQELFRRFSSVLVFLMALTGAGTFGFHSIGKGAWTIGDCLYMTVITLSTVGYGEVLVGFDQMEGARLFATLLIVLGAGSAVYAVSSLTAFIVEGDLRGLIRGRRMENRIAAVSGQFVVCGVGSTGSEIVKELAFGGRTVVAIDLDAEKLRKLDEALPNDRLLYVVGDATADSTLEKAGIERAAGLMAALHEDKDNVYVTISARALNPNIRIVTKSLEQAAVRKLDRAGADRIVSPYRIGALRMVGEMLRPKVVEFFDDMLHASDENLGIDEVRIPQESGLVGCAIRYSQIRDSSNALVLALRSEDGKFTYNPAADTELAAGMTLILLGRVSELEVLSQGILDGSVGRRPTP